MKRSMIAFAGAAIVCLAQSAANAALSWSTVVDASTSTTFSMRSVALAQDEGNDSVYIGYIQNSGNRYVYRYGSEPPYSQMNSLSLTYVQPKGLATDDRGYVYVGSREGSGSSAAIMNIYDSTLGTLQATYNASTNEFGGVATWKSGDNYYLYVAREANGEINRYDVTDLNAISLDASFGTNGTYTVAGANKLRGITLAEDGTIYVADRDNNALFRISSDLSSLSSAEVTRPMDVALFGGKAYVTSYNGQDSLIRVIDGATLGFSQDIQIDLLDGEAYVRGTSEGWSGIDIGDDGRIWLVDQLYQTSGSALDRLLVSSPIPEPGTLALLAFAGLAGMTIYAWRRRK